MPVEHLQRRVLDDVVDDLGFGPAQFLFVVLASGTSLCAGAVKVLAGVMASIVGAELGLGFLERSSLVAVVFAAQAVGNIIFGALADKIGRRPPLVACYFCVAMSAVGSAFAATFWTMLLWRAALGLCFGLCTTPWNSLAGEVCPSRTRLLMHALGGAVFTLGILYALALVWHEDPTMQNLDWRRLTLLSSLPAFLLLVPAYLWLLESPRFLDRADLREEAVEVLSRMRALNGREGVDVEVWSTGETVQDAGLKPIFSRALRSTTLILCFSTFALNYSYYGSFYALPRVLPGRELHLSAAGSMILNSMVELLGLALGVALDRRVSRRGGLFTYLLGVAFFNTLFFGILHSVPKHDGTEAGPPATTDTEGTMAALLVSAAMIGSQLSLSAGFIFVYLYSTEVYPTCCRAAGSGVAVGFGRLGAVVCPLAFEALNKMPRLGGHAHFAVVAGLASINAVLIFLLPLETKDRQLGSIACETSPVLAGAMPKTAP